MNWDAPIPARTSADLFTSLVGRFSEKTLRMLRDDLRDQIQAVTDMAQRGEVIKASETVAAELKHRGMW